MMEWWKVIIRNFFPNPLFLLPFLIIGCIWIQNKTLIHPRTGTNINMLFLSMNYKEKIRMITQHMQEGKAKVNQEIWKFNQEKQHTILLLWSMFKKKKKRHAKHPSFLHCNRATLAPLNYLLLTKKSHKKYYLWLNYI